MTSPEKVVAAEVERTAGEKIQVETALHLPSPRHPQRHVVGIPAADSRM